jgi:Domain of unknown function.
MYSYIKNLFYLVTSTIFPRDCTYQLAICSIFQNDASYLPEWIDFHEKQGVEHFFLYNNLSEDNYKEILAPYVKKGLVEIIDWPKQHKSVAEFNALQSASYMDCIKKNKKTCKWIAFLDTDEFLFSPLKCDLKMVLSKFLKVGGVCVNWVIYGTGNVEKIEPNEKMTDLLLWRAPFNTTVNKHVKSIVQPKYVVGCINAHHFAFFRGYSCVTENNDFVDSCFSDYVSVNLLRINHYFQRDLNFLHNIKLPRQAKWGKDANHEDLKNIESMFNDEYDDILLNSLRQ